MGFLYFLSHKSVINDLNIIKMGDSPFLFFFYFYFFIYLFIFFRKLYNIQQSIENSIRRVHDLSQSRASGARQTLRLSMSSFFVENCFDSTDRSSVCVTICCFVVYSTRRFVLCLTLCHFVLVFFCPFSIAITSLWEERANLSAFRTFVRVVLVWSCRFLGVWEGLRFVIVALPGLFSYLFFFFFFFFF